MKGGRRHILLGHFPVPSSTLPTRVTHDAVIPPFRPELGPHAKPNAGQLRLRARWGRVSSARKRLWPWGWGIQDPGTGRIQSAASSPAPHLERRTWTRAEEARRGVCVFFLGGTEKSEAQKASCRVGCRKPKATWGRSLCPFLRLTHSFFTIYRNQFLGESCSHGNHPDVQKALEGMEDRGGKVTGLSLREGLFQNDSGRLGVFCFVCKIVYTSIFPCLRLQHSWMFGFFFF